MKPRYGYGQKPSYGYGQPLTNVATWVQDHWATPRGRTVRVRRIWSIGRYGAIVFVRADFNQPRNGPAF